MKKTLLITDDFPPRIGGVAGYYAGLCGALPPDRIQVLTAPHPDGHAFDRHSGYRIYRYDLLSRQAFVWPKWIAALRHVFALQREQRYGRLLAGQILPYGTVAWVLHRRLSLPYAVVVHGMDIGIPLGRKRWLCRKILRDANHIIANSYGTADLLRQYDVPTTKVTVVTPAVMSARRPSPQLVREISERYDLQNRKVILTTGRLVARKGHRTVLAALQLLLKRFPHVWYVIVGDGPERSALERLAFRVNLREHVIFTGFVSPDELTAWYERCDVFTLLPQRSAIGDVEGFGTVFLEANSYAKPVVATIVPGVTEAVVDSVTGFLVDPHDPTQAAERFLQLLSDSGLAHRLGLQGQDRVAREFQWKDRAARVESLLR